MLKPSKRLSNGAIFKHRHNELFYLKCCCPGASPASSEADPRISWENVGTSCIRRYYTCLHQFFMHYRERKWDMQPLLLAFGLREKRGSFAYPARLMTCKVRPTDNPHWKTVHFPSHHHRNSPKMMWSSGTFPCLSFQLVSHSGQVVALRVLHVTFWGSGLIPL